MISEPAVDSALKKQPNMHDCAANALRSVIQLDGRAGRIACARASLRSQAACAASFSTLWQEQVEELIAVSLSLLAYSLGIIV